MDPYSASAEFYDLTSRELWARKRPLIMSGLRGATGTLVDIGAGTGLGTLALAETFPSAPIVAIEPSVGMRIALATRVAMTGIDVSVVDGCVPGVELPPRIGGALCCGVLGHLSASERVSLWTVLAARMDVGAPVVVELMDETAPPAFTLRIAHTRVGDMDYEVWSTPSDHGWTLRYRVLRAGRCLRELDVPMRWDRIDASVLAAEAVGFRCRRIAPDVHVLTRSAGVPG
ncbi:hypothetical protein [Kibdelosporangium aridum]|uniref:hypothetical protein n=1 Tax=Kibdelosporangium aridum TaxID=2030 RepID=UPI0035EB84D3